MVNTEAPNNDSPCRPCPVCQYNGFAGENEAGAWVCCEDVYCREVLVDAIPSWCPKKLG